MRHALSHWSDILEVTTGKRIALFLDYDGTLSPIVDHPEKAFMFPSMREVLCDVASQFTTSIVTGRSKTTICNFVKLDNLVYAASHGFDISAPAGLEINYTVADSSRPILEACQKVIKEKISQIPGAEVEDNTFAFSVHYRNADASYRDEILHHVETALKQHEGLCLKHGKMVYEIRPDVAWNKGRAVLWLLKELGLDRDDIIPIYIGDDVSDEDAFEALRKRSEGLAEQEEPALFPAPPDGSSNLTDQPPQPPINDTNANGTGTITCTTTHCLTEAHDPNHPAPVCKTKYSGGIGILVREDFDRERPAASLASFRLRNPHEVEQFLRKLLDLNDGVLDSNSSSSTEESTSSGGESGSTVPVSADRDSAGGGGGGGSEAGVGAGSGVGVNQGGGGGD